MHFRQSLLCRFTAIRFDKISDPVSRLGGRVSKSAAAHRNLPDLEQSPIPVII
jgi:hypothetical protein